MPGTWRQFFDPPNFARDLNTISTMWLLTDGSVLAQIENSIYTYRLYPGPNGDYFSGRWVAAANMNTPRAYFASAVLADGRLFVAGGEYAGGPNQVNIANVEIYDPVANVWTPIAGPSGWANIGDAPCCVLPDGRVLIGNIFSTNTTIFNPATNSFSPGPQKGDKAGEETWMLLANGTVLAVQNNVTAAANASNSEKYVPSPGQPGQWISDAQVPVSLVLANSQEIGPAVALPNGQAFFIGATGNTALYTPPSNPTQKGKWIQGPTLPNDPTGRILQPKDAPCCLLPNGKVLLVAGPNDGGVKLTYPPGMFFFEYDFATNSLTPAPVPTYDNSVLGPVTAVYQTRMLLLPTGQVLFAGGPASIVFPTELFMYIPDGAPQPAWKPKITSLPQLLFQGQTQTLLGRQLNGLSQACGYGDDVSMATNYPLVLIRNLATNHAKYARTANHSTMGVGTGDTIESTQYTVPGDAEPGPSELVVIANGISSDGWPVPVMFSVRIGLHLALKFLNGKGILSLETYPPTSSLRTLMANL